MNQISNAVLTRKGSQKPTMPDSHSCPSCSSGIMDVFYEAKSVPTNSCILLASAEEALQYPRGDIALGFCPKCGFICNVAFDPKLTEYSSRYEETQGFSQTFNKFHHALAERLVKSYDLNNKDILEIGCGKGEFITLLSQLGNNRGVGFDPGYREERNNTKAAKNVQFITDFYSEKYSNYKADFICCKMTLEHIPDTDHFISTVRKSIGQQSGTIVFFQIPEATRILKECAFEDIYYEHCSYFSPGSLTRLFRRNGFEVINVETEYDDQYLTIEAKPLVNKAATCVPLTQENDLEGITSLVAGFPQRCQKKIENWKKNIECFKEQDKKVVLWGSGSKGVSFLTTLDIGDKIEYVVDINPYRQGYYMSGTGQKIIAPKELKDYQPDVVIIMNAIYTEEITAQIKEMNLNSQIIPVR